MKARVKAGWRLTGAQRQELRDLVAAVDPEAGEEAAPFLGLLAYWESCGAPWDALPRVPGYECKARWLTAGVGPVVAAIRIQAIAGV